MGKLSALKMFCTGFAVCILMAAMSPAQTFTTLASFDQSNGYGPGYGALVQGINGNFYGTTSLGGPYVSVCPDYGCGVLFEITPAGKLSALYDFCSQPACADGSYPELGLVQATNGKIYGVTTNNGNCANCGTIFETSLMGKVSTFHSFCSQTGCTDGYTPFNGLLQAIDGNFYGTTYEGGTSAIGGGTVFKITPSGTFTTLYSFCVTSCSDGFGPWAGLIQGSDGNFYGTTLLGGIANDGGTVFKITPQGKLTTLYSFCSQYPTCPDGYEVYAGVIQGNDGNFYGTTLLGGGSGGGAGGGTVFKLTPNGTLTTLHSFCSQPNCADGAQPWAALVQATDGNLYGTTSVGGTPTSCFNPPPTGCGTIFRITPAGNFTTLYSFCSQPNCADGSVPAGGLVQATNGMLYGTNGGGVGGGGTVFSLSVGLRPFVKPLPSGGKVGSKVILLGNNLTGTTSVTFNGTATTFTVVSPTEITTTVPTGATTGKVQVTTPSGTLTSNVVFRIRQ